MSEGIGYVPQEAIINSAKTAMADKNGNGRENIPVQSLKPTDDNKSFPILARGNPDNASQGFRVADENHPPNFRITDKAESALPPPAEPTSINEEKGLRVIPQPAAEKDSKETSIPQNNDTSQTRAEQPNKSTEPEKPADKSRIDPEKQTESAETKEAKTEYQHKEADVSSQNFYERLGFKGVPPEEISRADIVSAVSDLMKKYHPDVNKDPDAEEIMKKINEARDILTNPVKREKFNTSLKKAEQMKNAIPEETRYEAVRKGVNLTEEQIKNMTKEEQAQMTPDKVTALAVAGVMSEMQNLVTLMPETAQVIDALSKAQENQEGLGSIDILALIMLIIMMLGDSLMNMMLNKDEEAMNALGAVILTLLSTGLGKGELKKQQETVNAALADKQNALRSVTPAETSQQLNNVNLPLLNQTSDPRRLDTQGNTPVLSTPDVQQDMKNKINTAAFVSAALGANKQAGIPASGTSSAPALPQSGNSK